MFKSFFRALTPVPLAVGLFAASSVASATTPADAAFLPAPTDSFSFFGATISASVPVPTQTTPSAPRPPTWPLVAGGTHLAWDHTAAPTFTIAGNGAMTFDGLVYNNTTSSVTGDTTSSTAPSSTTSMTSPCSRWRR